MRQAPRGLGQSRNGPKLSERPCSSAPCGAGGRGLATREEEIGRSGHEEPAPSLHLPPGFARVWCLGRGCGGTVGGSGATGARRGLAGGGEGRG